MYQDQSEGSKSSPIAPTNIPYSIDGEDIPSPLPTHPLSRRFSYSSAASRFVCTLFVSNIRCKIPLIIHF